MSLSLLCLCTIVNVKNLDHTILYQKCFCAQHALGFLSGGSRREHSLLLGLILPPLGNFILKVNQFKCLKYLVIALCILSVNKSLKYCMYIILAIPTTILLFLLHILSPFLNLHQLTMNWYHFLLYYNAGVNELMSFCVWRCHKIVVKTIISICD